MADPTLHIDITSASNFTPTGSWTDFTNLGGSAVIAGTGSVVIMMAIVTAAPGSAIWTDGFRFAVDGSPVGPTWSYYRDNTARMGTVCMVWAVDGLSAASHDFDVQNINLAGTSSGSDANFNHTLQVIELTADVTILVEQVATNAQSSPATFADVPTMVATVTPAASAHHIFTYGHIPNPGADRCAAHSFAINGGTRDGPEGASYCDSTSQFMFPGLVWFTDALTNLSQALSVQWEDRQGDPGVHVDHPRGFQVIEITADVDLLTDITLQSADTAPVSFEDMTGMTASPTIDSTNSVSIINAQTIIADAGDASADYQFTVGGTQEGPEGTCQVDEADGMCGNAMIYAITGESGSTDLAYQWEARNNVPALDTGRDRVFQFLEFQAAAAGRIMSSLAYHGGLAGKGGIAGASGGLAG